MCRTRQEIIEEEQIICEIDEHIAKNNLSPTDKMIMRTVRENLIRGIMAEEKTEERDKYPSLLYMAVKKPLMFFPAFFAFLVLLSTLFFEETRAYVFALAGIPAIEPDKYLAISFPLFGFLVITSIVGAKK